MKKEGPSESILAACPPMIRKEVTAAAVWT